MKTIQRIILFIFVCILVRSLLIWWASREETEKDVRQWVALGVITTIITVGFLTSGIGRKIGKIKQVGIFGGREVYWNSFLHGILYLLFTGLWFFKVNDDYPIRIPELYKNSNILLGNYLVFSILYTLRLNSF